MGADPHDSQSTGHVAGEPPPELRPIVFAIRLPFDLPVPHGAGFELRRSTDENELPWVALTVVRLKIEPRAALIQPYEAGLAVLLGDVEPDLSAGSSSQT